MSEEISSSDRRRLERLLRERGASEYELDLKGLDLAHALASIDRMAERQRFRIEEREVAVKLDPASPKSGETLFQPVGRHLLGLMRRGLVARCRPLAGDAGAGFEVILPAGKAPSESADENAGSAQS